MRGSDDDDDDAVTIGLGFGGGVMLKGTGDEVKVAARSALRASAISSSSSAYVFGLEDEDAEGVSSAGGMAAGMLSLVITFCSLVDRTTLTQANSGVTREKGAVSQSSDLYDTLS